MTCTLGRLFAMRSSETIEVVYSLFRSLVMIGDRPTIEFIQDNVGNLIENARRAEGQKEG
jgi:hypothetical protein